MNHKEKLFDNLRNDKINEIKDFIDANPTSDYNIKDETGTYFIFYVVAVNRVDILEKLLTTNIRTDIYDMDGRTILYSPIKFGFYEIVKMLIKHSESVIGIPIQSLVDDNGNIALHYSIMFKNVECFDLLLPISNLAFRDKVGNDALHHAVMSRMLDFVKKVNIKTNDVNTQNNSGETSLHIATRLGLYDITKYLVSNKASINVQEFHKQTSPLHYACFNGNEKIVSMLLENNADVNIQDFDGNTPLHYCVMHDRINIVHILLNNKKQQLNVNLFNINLSLPLHIVLNNVPDNFHKYIEFLLPKTNVNFQNKFGTSCLHELCRLSIWQIYAEVLKSKKLDILLEDYQKMRPIDYVDKKNYESFIELVTESYVTLITQRGKTWSLTWENECNNNIEKCREAARKKILNLIKSSNSECNKKTYPIKSGSNKCIKIDFDDRITINTLVGTPLDILSGLIFLKNKHADIKITMGKFDVDDTSKCKFFVKYNLGRESFDCVLEKYFITWYKNTLDIDPSIKDMILQSIKNPKIKSIVFFIGIVHYDGSGHANIILYTKKTNEIERFDPFGSGDYDEMDIKLKNYFEALIPNVKYVSPKDYMSMVGFQKIDITEGQNEYIGDPAGYCVAWSIWYADMRISFPDLSRQKLIKYIMQQIGEKHFKYRSIIRNYTRNITKIRDNIISVADIDVNEYNNREYDDDKVSKIITKLNDELD